MPRVKQLQCRTCGQPRPFEWQSPAHALHVVMSIITGGLWLLVWLMDIVFSSGRPVFCRTCGEKRMGNITVLVISRTLQAAAAFVVGFSVAAAVEFGQWYFSEFLPSR